MGEDSKNGGHSPSVASALSFLASSLAVSLAVTVTNPLDVIKVRLQIQRDHAFARGAKYPGTLKGIQRIVAEERLSGLYKGVGPGILRGAVHGGTRLWLYEPIKIFFAEEGTENVSLTRKVAAGFTSGMVTGIITNPLEYLKIQQQAQSGSVRLSALNIMRNGVKTNGVLVLWSGWVSSSQRAGLLTAGQMATYDYLKNDVFREDTATTRLMSAVGAGLVATFITSPHDVIKTRMMNAGAGAAQESSLAVMREMFREGGLQAFFKGTVPSLLRQGPQTLLILTMVDGFRTVFGVKNV